MRQPADDLDDDLLDDDEVVLLNGDDFDDHDDDEDEDPMENRIELKEDRTKVRGGEHADDDKAVEALERDQEEVQAAREEMDERAARQEELLDEGVEETFPASDPVSVKRIT